MLVRPCQLGPRTELICSNLPSLTLQQVLASDRAVPETTQLADSYKRGG